MKKSGRIAFLVFLFAGLLMIYLWQQYLASFPREPRLIFENGGLSGIDRLVVETSSRKIDLGRVRAGRTIVLPIEPETGDVYTIEGNQFSGPELIYYLSLARQARADVRLGIDEHGCGWIEEDGPFHHDGYPSKRVVTPNPSGSSY
jgi:hypothetical protein